jgi:hypothetical protein
MDALPVEIIAHILSSAYETPRKSYQIAMVCKLWQKIITPVAEKSTKQHIDNLLYTMPQTDIGYLGAIMSFIYNISPDNMKKVVSTLSNYPISNIDRVICHSAKKIIMTRVENDTRECIASENLSEEEQHFTEYFFQIYKNEKITIKSGRIRKGEKTIYVNKHDTLKYKDKLVKMNIYSENYDKILHEFNFKDVNYAYFGMFMRIICKIEQSWTDAFA